MTTATLDARAWNCMVSNTGANVTKALAAFAGADVIVLTEATGFHADIAAFAISHGYTVWHEAPTNLPGRTITEHGDTALLVTDKAKVVSHGIIAMRQEWVGPKNGWPHEPRRYPYACFTLRGVTWNIVAAHWPTGYGTTHNKAAVTETLTQASERLRLPGPTVELGDLNVGTYTLTQWARNLGATVAGKGPDNALMKDCAGTATVLDHYGSDHPAVAYTFTTTVKEAPVPTPPAPKKNRVQRVLELLAAALKGSKGRRADRIRKAQAALTPKPKPAPVVPVKPYALTTHDGKKVDVLTDLALKEAERRLGYPLTIVQGSYNAGGVSASAGTHDGGGVVDLSPWDWERKVHVMRAVGFAAWHRPALPGVWNEHIHCVLIGNAKLSPAAANQVTDYYQHKDGLAGHGPDNTWHPNPIPVFKIA